jgi:hypothetical protein
MTTNKMDAEHPVIKVRRQPGDWRLAARQDRTLPDLLLARPVASNPKQTSHLRHLFIPKCQAPRILLL